MYVMKKAFRGIILILIAIFAAGCAGNAEPAVVRFAVPYSDYVRDYSSNYYVNWLEEQTNTKIEFMVIKQKRSTEYLDSLFASDVNVDAVLFGGDFLLSSDELSKYADAGKIYTLSSGENYFPNYGTSKTEGAGQVMWINSDWLSELSLSIPSTTEELAEVLKCFKEKDPNRNGLADEIPLIGSLDSYPLNPCEYLLNSFIYNDPFNSRFAKESGKEFFVPATDDFGLGLEYLKRLYDENLLDKRTFSYSKDELEEIINSPLSLVGAFTTDSIADVLYRGNPEIMARYIHVPPLKGDTGEQNSLYVEKQPKIGAIIPKKAFHKETAELVLKMMGTPEASLIARFGEEHEDWEYADGSDVSIYGTSATIVTKSYIWDTVQNKHLNGIGPINVPKEYLEGITWNGINSDTEYIDARAKMNCADCFPKEISNHGYDVFLAEAVDNLIVKCIKGEEEIEKGVFEKIYTDTLNSFDGD